MLGGSGDASLTKRLAGTIFIIRVISAALAYLSQILLARWMGGSDYGVYVYVWTWVLLLGSMMDFGISASAQKLIPEYRASGDHALLRGFNSLGVCALRNLPQKLSQKGIEIDNLEAISLTADLHISLCVRV